MVETVLRFFDLYGTRERKGLSWQKGLLLEDESPANYMLGEIILLSLIFLYNFLNRFNRQSNHHLQSEPYRLRKWNRQKPETRRPRLFLPVDQNEDSEPFPAHIFVHPAD